MRVMTAPAVKLPVLSHRVLDDLLRLPDRTKEMPPLTFPGKAGHDMRRFQDSSVTFKADTDRLFKEKLQFGRGMRGMTAGTHASGDRHMNIFPAEWLFVMTGKTEVRHWSGQQLLIRRRMRIMTGNTEPYADRGMDNRAGKFGFIMTAKAEVRH